MGPAILLFCLFIFDGQQSRCLHTALKHQFPIPLRASLMWAIVGCWPSRWSHFPTFCFALNNRRRFLQVRLWEKTDRCSAPKTPTWMESKRFTDLSSPHHQAVMRGREVVPCIKCRWCHTEIAGGGTMAGNNENMSPHPVVLLLLPPLCSHTRLMWHLPTRESSHTNTEIEHKTEPKKCHNATISVMLCHTEVAVDTPQKGVYFAWLWTRRTDLMEP